MVDEPVMIDEGSGPGPTMPLVKKPSDLLKMERLLKFANTLGTITLGVFLSIWVILIGPLIGYELAIGVGVFLALYFSIIGIWESMYRLKKKLI